MAQFPVFQIDALEQKQGRESGVQNLRLRLFLEKKA